MASLGIDGLGDAGGICARPALVPDRDHQLVPNAPLTFRGRWVAGEQLDAGAGECEPCRQEPLTEVLEDLLRLRDQCPRLVEPAGHCVEVGETAETLAFRLAEPPLTHPLEVSLDVADCLRDRGQVEDQRLPDRDPELGLLAFVAGALGMWERVRERGSRLAVRRHEFAERAPRQDKARVVLQRSQLGDCSPHGALTTARRAPPEALLERDSRHAAAECSRPIPGNFSGLDDRGEDVVRLRQLSDLRQRLREIDEQRERLWILDRGERGCAGEQIHRRRRVTGRERPPARPAEATSRLP
ncbi:MAG: hypothetical protein HOQ28_01925 [Thermoleophilia bacterium]|nr:hypothetical protein [Thermoleophilia bacterium]